VRSLIELGHRLGLRVVAEGVETATQLAALRRLECDAAQGHQVGRPLAGGAVEPWLRAEAGAAVRPGAPRDPAGRGRA
jgi:EAL domain-containing protein (putative c-di-GMP-specific phosphodiesterase class I)